MGRSKDVTVNFLHKTMSVKEIAQKVGVSERLVRYWLKNEKRPGKDNLKLIKAFVKEVMEEEDLKKKELKKKGGKISILEYGIREAEKEDKKKKELIEVKGLEIGKLKRPTFFPKNWNYEKSLDLVRVGINKWKNVTVLVAKELYIAREVLAAQGQRTDLGKKLPKLNWTTYCEAIGSERHTVNNWLRRFFGKSELEEPEDESESKLTEVRLELETLQCMVKSYPAKDRLFGEKCPIQCYRKQLCGQIATILQESPILIKQRAKLEKGG